MAKLKVNEITPLKSGILTINNNLKLGGNLTVNGSIDYNIEWPLYLYNIINPALTDLGTVDSSLVVETNKIAETEREPYISGYIDVPVLEDYSDTSISAYDGAMEIVNNYSFIEEEYNVSVQGMNKPLIQNFGADNGIWWKPPVPWQKIKKIRVFTNLMGENVPTNNLPSFKIAFDSSHDFYSVGSVDNNQYGDKSQYRLWDEKSSTKFDKTFLKGKDLYSGTISSYGVCGKNNVINLENLEPESPNPPCFCKRYAIIPLTQISNSIDVTGVDCAGNPLRIIDNNITNAIYANFSQIITASTSTGLRYVRCECECNYVLNKSLSQTIRIAYHNCATGALEYTTISPNAYPNFKYICSATNLDNPYPRITTITNVGPCMYNTQSSSYKCGTSGTTNNPNTIFAMNLSENPGDEGTLWGELDFSNSTYWVGDLGPGNKITGKEDWLSSYINVLLSPNGVYDGLKFYYEIYYK